MVSGMGWYCCRHDSTDMGYYKNNKKFREKMIPRSILLLSLLILQYCILSTTTECKTFAHVGTISSRSSWKHENISLLYGNREEYRLVKRLGQGTFGEGYLGYNVKHNFPCVIKIFTDRMSREKMLNEIVILQNLCGGPNIVKVHDVLQESMKETPAIVFEYINSTNAKSLYPKFVGSDVQFYIKELLKALDYVHNEGIIHRDVKPSNILIDHYHRKLTLIDFGLSVFHYRGQNHTIAGTRFFKAPELLLHLYNFDFAADIWSVGALFAGMIFQKEFFFTGSNSLDQLASICNVLGSADLIKFVSKSNFPIPSNHTLLTDIKTKIPFSQLKTAQNSHLVTDDAIDLLSKMLAIDPEHRIKAADALKHPYLNA